MSEVKPRRSSDVIAGTAVPRGRCCTVHDAIASACRIGAGRPARGGMHLPAETFHAAFALDGDEAINFIVPLDSFVSKEFTVWNEDEGGDWGVITMTLNNFAV